MEERKLNDEEIIKDIERSTGMPSYWKKIVLDLIHRLNGENKKPKRKKILANRVYSDATLKGWKKEDLIEQIRILEHNWAAAEGALNNSAKNSDKIFAEQKAEIERLKRYEMTESEFQKYCAYKIIEPQIRGCLDRERELQKQVDELKNERENMQAEILRFEDMKFTQEHCDLYSENETLKQWLKRLNADLENEKNWGKIQTKQAVKDTAKEIITEYSKMLVDEFIKSADIQDFVTVRNTLRNVCPAKVSKIKKKISKRYGVEVDE